MIKTHNLERISTAAHHTRFRALAKHGAASPRKRRKASKGTTPTVVLPSKEAPDAYAKLQSLDEEIGRLRRELAQKLQLQKAQVAV